MAAALITTMRQRAVREADAVGVIDPTDAADKLYLDDYLVGAFLPALHDKLTLAFEDYQLTEASGQTIASGADTVAVPSTMLKLRDVEFVPASGERVSLNTIAWTERNTWRGERRYCVGGANIFVRPKTLAPGTYSIWHTPQFAMTGAADTRAYDAINGWEEWAVLMTAIQIKADQQQSTTVLERRLAALEAHIAAAARGRVSARPGRVRRVRRTVRDALILNAEEDQ